MRKSFKATCRLAVPVPMQDLTEEQEKARAATAVRHDGEWCALVPHEHEFTDPYLFEQHMSDVHSRKAGARVWGISAADAAYVGKPYSKPRLTKDGKPFEPEGFEPGALIDVPGYGRCQVWCKGEPPKSAWAVPCEPVDGVSAVLVQELGSGRLDVALVAKTERRQVAVGAGAP